jgi:hypothetical protein
VHGRGAGGRRVRGTGGGVDSLGALAFDRDLRRFMVGEAGIGGKAIDV